MPTKSARKRPAKKRAAKKGTAKSTRKATKKKAAKRRAAPKRAATKSASKKGDPLERLRAIIGAWPETDERISHGSPTFWGGKKTFASFHVNHHGDGRVALWLKLPEGAQGQLVESDPEIFFVPPYVGPSGWVGVRLDRTIDWTLVAGLLEEGYRSVAPSRAIAILDAS